MGYLLSMMGRSRVNPFLFLVLLLLLHVCPPSPTLSKFKTVVDVVVDIVVDGCAVIE